MRIDIVVVYTPRYERGHEKNFVPPITGIHLAAITPPAHRVRVVHLGKARDATWRAAAEAEAAGNPRYAWKGEVPRWRVRGSG